MTDPLIKTHASPTTPMRRLPFLILLLLPACKPAEQPPVQLEPPAIILPASVRLLDPAAVQTLIDSQPRLQIIDCRMESEFHSGRLPGAHHMNYFTPDEARLRLQKLDPARPSLVYCALGTRSAETALVMHELGFKDIVILDGGIHAWLTAKLALTR